MASEGRDESEPRVEGERYNDNRREMAKSEKSKGNEEEEGKKKNDKDEDYDDCNDYDGKRRTFVPERSSSDELSRGPFPPHHDSAPSSHLQQRSVPVTDHYLYTIFLLVIYSIFIFFLSMQTQR